MCVYAEVASPTFTGIWREGIYWHVKHDGEWVGSFENLDTATRALQRRITQRKLAVLRRRLARAVELHSARIGEG